MGIRTPNPCDDVVEIQEQPESGDNHQGNNDGDQTRIETTVMEPVFAERTITAPVALAGRTITMIDEEFFIPFIPPHRPDSVRDFIDEDAVYTPSWYVGQKIQEAKLHSIQDTGSFDLEKIDFFRAGLLSLWHRDWLDQNQEHIYLNAANEWQNTGIISLNSEDYNIPLDVRVSSPSVQNEETLSCRTRVELHPTPDRVQTLTHNYSDFQNHAPDPQKAFYNLYFLGSESRYYSIDTTSDASRSTYEHGLLPRPKSTFTDSVFETPLPFHKRESNFLNVPAYNVVDISLESKGFLSDAYSFPIVSEYQKPSIYRSFYEDKKLETLELPGIQGGDAPNCIAHDRIQKFPSDRVEMMSIANEKLEKQSESFIRVKIATPQGQDNLIAELLKNNKMDRHILDLLTSEEEHYSSEEEIFTQLMRDVVYVAGSREEDVFTNNDRTRQGVLVKVNNKMEVKINDQTMFVERGEMDISEYPMGFFNHDKPILLSFEDAITSQIFTAELRDHVKTNKFNRSFVEIMLGKKAHSEIIAFHVEKADAETGDVIQDFYFSDSNDVVEIDFVDNQILKGKKYRYRVYAVNMVIATDYRYEDFETSDVEGEPVIVPVTTNVKYSIIETPYFEKNVSVFDRPPMFPQVSFIPYQGIDNQIGFLLQDNGGEILEAPIEIFKNDHPLADEERARVENMSSAQDKNPGAELLYGSDDLPTGFEILCMTREEPPTSFDDFQEAEVKSFPAYGKTGFFKMDIEPNKYYYAIFRTVEDEMVSNPTEVFRFMMVSYQNGIFLDMQTIELNPPKIFTPITFEKILKLEPSDNHWMLNVSPGIDATAQERTDFTISAPEITTADIGAEEKPLWGKKFKIRLRSRSTSKELDINVVFEKKVNYINAATDTMPPRRLARVCNEMRPGPNPRDLGGK